MSTPLSRILPALAAAAAALAGLAAAPANAGFTKGGEWNFVSSPVRPASISVTTNRPGQEPGYVFAAPIANAAHPGHFLGQHGPTLYDSLGNPIWVHPTPAHYLAMTFRPETYLGQPVLTWWQGKITVQGFGYSGFDVIVDSHYRTVATLRTGKGINSDFHDIVLTPDGNAYITGWKTVNRDLRRYGGSSHGQVLDSVIQEVNVKSGRVLWTWDALSHISPGDAFQGPSSNSPWDAYHLNSIDLDASGKNLLVSVRNTWAIYQVSRKTGRISFTVGGKHSSYKLASGVRFAWQHDAHFGQNSTISLFDDEAAPTVSRQSRAEVIRLDSTHRVARLVSQYTHASPALLSGSQGSTQLLANANVFVGWGQMPYLSEYSASGLLVWDAHFHGPDETYRAYRDTWVGDPPSNPAAAVQRNGSTTTVFASWNGKTGVAAWRVLSGPDPGHLGVAGGPAGWGGFETAIGTGAGGPYYAVQALDGGGRVIGQSPAVHG